MVHHLQSLHQWVWGLSSGVAEAYGAVPQEDKPLFLSMCWRLSCPPRAPSKKFTEGTNWYWSRYIFCRFTRRQGKQWKSWASQHVLLGAGLSKVHLLPSSPWSDQIVPSGRICWRKQDNGAFAMFINNRPRKQRSIVLAEGDVRGLLLPWAWNINHLGMKIIWGCKHKGMLPSQLGFAVWKGNRTINTL